MRIVLVNPPVADPAGPYPAIAYLAGFLNTIGYRAQLVDASLDLLLKVFSAKGVRLVESAVRAAVERDPAAAAPMVRAFLDRADRYAAVVDTAVACLQRRDAGALARAGRPNYFPPPLEPEAKWALTAFLGVQAYEAALGPLTTAQRARVASATNPIGALVGATGSTDEVRLRAIGVLEDLCEVIRRAVDPDFEIRKYATRLSYGVETFGPLGERLGACRGPIDALVDELADELLAAHQPDVVGFSVPFAGVLYGALRIARRLRARVPAVRTILGGGFVNTALRDLTDPGIFDEIDFITLDDGEKPLQCVLEFLEGRRSEDRLLRTFVRRGGRVILVNAPGEADVSFASTGTPTYAQFPLDQYLYYGIEPAVLPGYRFFGRRYNKLTLAHGCYWKRCTFCDTSLDYIRRYEPAAVDVVIDRIKRVQQETGESGFHFVDEAMPPALLGRLAERLLEEQLTIAWWGNVRFDKALVRLAPLLAASGCIAFMGGLEAADDRLLRLIDKGVSLEQAAQVCGALAHAGIFTHAYLIYGYPTETAQETVDALEFVRQMFEAGCLQSAAWHRFVLAAWSPIAQRPQEFGIVIPPRPKAPFANYLIEYEEPGGIDHDLFGRGLVRAIEQYVFGTGFDRPVHEWFGPFAPKATLASDFVRRAIAASA